jgi:membrane fusion protein (multidrug efflux system)
MTIERKGAALAAALLLAAGFALSGCDKAASDAAGQGGAGMGPSGPAPVSVLAVQPQAAPLSSEMPGRTVAYLVSDVRPQVGGIVKARLFEEGSDVKAGDVLYQIDPATYQASLDSAKAALAKAKATVVSARLKAQRYKELVGINAVSKQDADDASATLAEAEADVAADAAALESAQINLDYTKVTAPISGRIGKSSVTPGALVTASQTDALATVQQLDPIYVDVTQPSTQYLKLKRALASGQVTQSGSDAAKVKLVLEDGTTYAEAGTLQFSDVTVDQTTGSITLRAIFPNPHHDLLPGMYVRAVIDLGQESGVFLVPQQAVSRNAKGDATVMVVGEGDKVEPRALTASRMVGTDWVVTAGLKPGDRVIIDGLQKLRPGMPVQPVDKAAAAESSQQPGQPTQSAQ